MCFFPVQFSKICRTALAERALLVYLSMQTVSRTFFEIFLINLNCSCRYISRVIYIIDNKKYL